MLKSTTNNSALRVLLLGYSGANNTGAEALLLADIEDVRAVLGPERSDHHPQHQPGKLEALCQRDAQPAHRLPADHFLFHTAPPGA